MRVNSRIPPLTKPITHGPVRLRNLVDDELLRYRFLNNFDRALNEAEMVVGWLHPDTSSTLCVREGGAFQERPLEVNNWKFDTE